METVDKLFSMVTDDRDPLLLVLGSLAEFTSEPVSVLVVCFCLCCLLFYLFSLVYSSTDVGFLIWSEVLFDLNLFFCQQSFYCNI